MLKDMELEHKTVIEIIPTSPFHFDSTFYKPGHFPSGDTKWESRRRWQTTLWKGEKLGLVYENTGTKSSPKVVVKIFSNKVLPKDFLESLRMEMIWRFN